MHSISQLENPIEDVISIVDNIVENYTINYESINAGGYIIKQLVFSALFSVPVPEKYLIAINSLLLHRFIKVSQNIPHFSKLPTRLQNVLLKHNAYMNTILRETCYNERNRKFGRIQGLPGFDKRECSEDMIKMLLKADEDPSKIYEKNCQATLSKYMKQPEFERIHLLIQIIQPKVAYDPNIIILLSHVVLFCSDFEDESISTTEKSCIEKIQEEISSLLQRYLFAKFPRGMAILGFSKVMETLVDLREIATIKMKANQKMEQNLDWDNHQKRPKLSF